MGSGSIGNRSGYKTVRGYYISGGCNEGFGGKFNFLLEPLIGNDDERFFYVEKTDNGKYEVTGEGYVITSKDSLYRHLKCLKKELQGKCIWYYHIDSAGCVLRKEKDHELYT